MSGDGKVHYECTKCAWMNRILASTENELKFFENKVALMTHDIMMMKVILAEHEKKG